MDEIALKGEMMEKRKVLFVAHHLTVGGAQKSMVAALKAIDYDENDVTLYVRKKRLTLLPEINDRVKVIVNDDQTHYYRNIGALWSLLRIKLLECLKKERKAEEIRESLSDSIRQKMMDHEYSRYFSGQHYDVAISYIQGYTADLVAEKIDADKKYVFYHSSTDEAHEFHEKAFAKYDGIIGAGDRIRDVVRELYPHYREKVGSLANYVDAEAVRAKADEYIPEVTGEKIRICSCGRLNVVKGFDLAIETAKQLKEKSISFIWYFVGDGPEREKLEKMIEDYDLTEEIVITGMQQNPYPWIKAADIYVQPSYEEAHPLTIIEAQILCKPVVTTATVGGKYLVKDGVNGLVADINASALAEKIESLIRNKDLRKQMETALRDVDHSEEFDDYKAAWKALLEG